MEESDIEFKLLAGLPIPIPDAGQIHIPTLKEIVQLNMSRYNGYLAALLIDKTAFQTKLAETITNFDLFVANCRHNEGFWRTAAEAIELFFKQTPALREDSRLSYVQIGEGRLTQGNFSLVQKAIQIGNNVKLTHEPEFKPADSRAAKMIGLIMKNREKQPKPKEKMDLQSIVAGLAWNNNGFSFADLFDLNLYQIYNGFYTTNHIDNYHHIVTAIYAGTIDGKSIKLSDIHWANKQI